MDLLPSKEWSKVNMLAHISSNHHFSRADTTKDKVKEVLLTFWNEKVNNPNTYKAAKERAKALVNTVELVMDSNPALSIINSNIKIVTSTQLLLTFIR
jgi:hypothetical protein